MASTVAILGLNLITGVLLARAFDPAGRGEVALIVIWPTMLAAVAQLGLPEAVTFHTARRTSPSGTILGSGLLIATARALVVLAVAAAILPFILGPHGATVELAGYLFLGFVPGHAYNPLQLAILNGQERYRAVAVLRLLVIAGAAVPMVALFALDELTLVGVALCYVGAQVLALATSAIMLRGTWREIAISRPLTRELLHYGVRAHLGTLSAELNLRVDQLIVSLFLSTRDLGLYVVAATLATLTSVVGATIGYVVVPVTARARNDEERAVDARRYTTLTVFTSAAITIPLVIFAPTVLRTVFGPDYASVADVARILLVGSISFSTARCLEAILRAIGMPWQASVGELIAVGVTVVGLAALLPLFGLTGAALASLLAYVTSLAWMLRLTARRLRIPTRTLILVNADDLRSGFSLVRRIARRTGT